MQWANRLFGYGLLDDDKITEQQRKQLGSASLLDAGLAMLANSGYSYAPQTTGQVVAQGVMAGRQGYADRAGQLQEQMKARAMQEQAAAALSRLPPEWQQYASVVGPEKALAEYMDQQNKLALEQRKAELKPQDKYRTLTAEEKAAQGINADGPVQINERTGRIVGTGGQTINFNAGGQAPTDPLSRIVTPDQRAMLKARGINLAEGVEYAWDKNNMPVPIKGTEPTKADENREAKAPQAANAGMLLSQMQQSLDGGLSTGPWNELFGIPIGRWTDKEKEQFEAVKEQLSSQIRAIFRIPGEGTLSDKEQAQYGLTLPSLDKRPETNLQLIQNLRVMIGNMTGGGQQVSDDDLINKYLGQ